MKTIIVVDQNLERLNDFIPSGKCEAFPLSNSDMEFYTTSSAEYAVVLIKQIPIHAAIVNESIQSNNGAAAIKEIIDALLAKPDIKVIILLTQENPKFDMPSSVPIDYLNIRSTAREIREHLQRFIF